MSKSPPTKAEARSIRRAERREEAIAAAQRKKRLQLLAYIGIGAIALAALLIFVNRPDDAPADVVIDYASIPQNGTILGNPEAPVTLVEYADYQCPACGKFAREALPKVIQDFVVSGQVNVEFRVYPFLGGPDLTSPDNESVNAAMAAECARDQGKFWEFNHALFSAQEGENAGGFSNEHLTEIATEVGLDLVTFTSCFESGEHRQLVIDSHDAAVAAGISSTPTLILNGVQVAYTTQGYDLLKTQIEAAIAGEPIP